ncbi:hypothetical protein AA13595_2678 [Gluconacetobacter johannae DSM 13595]|uniref:Uncharacterized protein n=1 Tax=Gluconacetobacter johannae TaxID=112140 RepID=A0A7W4J925_9PROT|nr:hypothetical protein [Gluconacetobacter johannae]MBB2176928.1 hypothetical protein [Gluconacetobacter johannae]GBQ89579.1 hypothetical protein AA13595_2678 [Gluconacetobacter johannae DSM 13595]
MSVYNESLPFSGETEQADIDNRDEVSEQALRLALSRLGSKRSAPSPSPSPTPAASARLPRAHDPAQRRRKFVQDGEVRVEHHAMSRPTPRTLHVPTDDGGEVERLRQQVRHEQKLREDAERASHDAQASLRSLETRIGHADIILTEAKSQIEARDDEIQDLKADLLTARAETTRLEAELAQLRSRTTTPAAAPIRRPRRPIARIEEPEDEPEPVKWWIKKK